MDYQGMFQKFQSGQITTDQWISFCHDYFQSVILTDPVVVGIITRLRDR